MTPKNVGSERAVRRSLDDTGGKVVGEGGDGGRGAIGGGWGVICGSVVDILEEAVWLHHDPSAIAEATMALDKVPPRVCARRRTVLLRAFG